MKLKGLASALVALPLLFATQARAQTATPTAPSEIKIGMLYASSGPVRQHLHAGL